MLYRPANERVFSVAAALRMGILVGSGDVVIAPPLGFGFGARLAYYPFAIARARIGFAFHGGHTRYPTQRSVVLDDPQTTQPRSIRRWSVLAHTDLALGPHVQIPVGPLFLEFGAGGGLGVSSYLRAVGNERGQDELTVSYDGLVRADFTFGIPIRNNQGLGLGLDLHQFFSKTRVVTVPDAPAGTPPDSVIFDLTLAVTLAYQMWF